MSGSLPQLIAPVFRLLGVVREERRLFLRSTLSMTAFQLATALSAGISTLIATRIATANSAFVGTLLLGLGAAAITVAAFTWIESWLSHVLAYRILDVLRMRVYDAVQRIVPSKTGKRRTGEISGTAIADVEALEWFYAHTLGTGLNAIVTPMLLSGLLLTLVGPVALVVPAGALLLVLIPWLFTPLQLRQGTEIRRNFGELQAVAFEGEQARHELASLGLTEHHHRQVLARTTNIQTAKRSFALRAAVETALADTVIAVTSLGFLVALIAAAARGALTPTVIPAALVLLSATLAPAAGAFAMTQRIGEMSAAARRVLELFDHAAAQPASGDTQLTTVPRGEIRFDAVSFGYTDGTQVFDRLDMTIRAGDHVALVGASGAGKTTVARLITGLWQPNSGRVLLDGTDVSLIDGSSLRHAVGMVAQHPFVFQGTVRSNLLLAAPNAPDDALWQALRDAGLDDLVSGFTHGLDERIGDAGATLSGGQRQRLSIAQALLRDPAVLIFDEAAAQLDALNEADLAAAVERLRAGRTTITIAHRVSTIRRAERILMIEAGRIVASGTHQELLATSAHYRALIAYRPI